MKRWLDVYLVCFLVISDLYLPISFSVMLALSIWSQFHGEA
jgi:hypothetical protein